MSTRSLTGRDRRQLVRRSALALALLVAVSGALAGGTALAAPQPPPPAGTEYTVLLEDGADPAAARRAIESAGGVVLRENPAVGMTVVRAPDDGFIERATAALPILGAARSRPFAALPDLGLDRPRPMLPGIDRTEQEHRQPRLLPLAVPAVPALPGLPLGAPSVTGRSTTSGAPAGPAPRTGLDPLDAGGFNLPMVRADAARRVEAGDRRVRVGVLDSGVDARHPDLAGQVDLKLSRNFARDIPTDPGGQTFDGPCEVPSCLDPVDRDDLGHGTHVAGIIAAAADGRGVSGVAPGVRLVSIRGGQDSGLLFLEPVVDALTYGTDIGLDVINMSFGVDPWVFNCLASPSDPPEARIEQRTILTAMDRALRYAHRGGVTLVGSLGNDHQNLDDPRVDRQSPTYPLGRAMPRTLDDKTCRTVPAEGPDVIGVSALGPSRTKADYSNYGLEAADLSGPGGWLRDGVGTPTYMANQNLVLSTFPVAVLQQAGDVGPDGEITDQGRMFGTQRDCTGGRCGYYAYLQGTSMATPHVAGTAALVVSRFGKQGKGDRWALPPAAVERRLRSTAADRACPAPVVSYAAQGLGPEYDAPCVGTPARNGHYGDGIVDAFAAVSATGPKRGD